MRKLSKKKEKEEKNVTLRSRKLNELCAHIFLSRRRKKVEKKFFVIILMKLFLTMSVIEFKSSLYFTLKISYVYCYMPYMMRKLR